MALIISMGTPCLGTIQLLNSLPHEVNVAVFTHESRFGMPTRTYRLAGKGEDASSKERSAVIEVEPTSITKIQITPKVWAY